MMVWTILAVGHQRNIAARLYWNLPCSFWQEKFSIYIYRKNKPRPLERFLTNYHRLNNLGRGSPKKHFWYISYWNQSSGFWQEEFYSFLYSYIGKTSPTHGDRDFFFFFFFWKTMMVWTILIEGHKRSIAVILYWNRSSSFWQEYILQVFL